jgi:ectoine hydroxylase-related dioxygenase (phytanoyl-CoA dioxygenase family)
VPDPALTYENQSIVSALARAGDCTLQNGQNWHCGAPNRTTDRVSVVQQVSYGRRLIAQRFYPFVNYHMPEQPVARRSRGTTRGRGRWRRRCGGG